MQVRWKECPLVKFERKVVVRQSRKHGMAGVGFLVGPKSGLKLHAWRGQHDRPGACNGHGSACCGHGERWRRMRAKVRSGALAAVCEVVSRGAKQGGRKFKHLLTSLQQLRYVLRSWVLALKGLATRLSWREGDCNAAVKVWQKG